MKIAIFVACLLLLLALIAGATNVGLIVRDQKVCIGTRRCHKEIPMFLAAISTVLFYATLLATVHTPFVRYLDTLPGAATATITSAQTSCGLLLFLAIAYGYVLYYVTKFAERLHHDILRNILIDALERYRTQTYKELLHSGELNN